MIAALLLAAGCIATDGDSLRCDRERIRLLGIDAPEMNYCPPKRRCAPGDPIASRDNLRRLAEAGPITIDRVTTDRYGRTIAVVYIHGKNLSCEQLRRGQAIYRPDWDNGYRIARACPALTR